LLLRGLRLVLILILIVIELEAGLLVRGLLRGGSCLAAIVCVIGCLVNILFFLLGLILVLLLLLFLRNIHFRGRRLVGSVIILILIFHDFLSLDFNRFVVCLRWLSLLNRFRSAWLVF
jgi:hypothetical protein